MYDVKWCSSTTTWAKKDMPKPLNTSNHTWSTLETSIRHSIPGFFNSQLLIHLKVGSSCRNPRIWPKISWMERFKNILKSYIMFVALFVKIHFYDSLLLLLLLPILFAGKSTNIAPFPNPDWKQQFPGFLQRGISVSRNKSAKWCQSSPTATVHEIWVPTVH